MTPTPAPGAGFPMTEAELREALDRSNKERERIIVDFQVVWIQPTVESISNFNITWWCNWVFVVVDQVLNKELLNVELAAAVMAKELRQVRVN